MRIAYITAGAAGMYCGSCLNDNTLAAALMKDGHEVALVPTYTPTRTEADNVSLSRVFYGAVNVYLKSTYPLFRHSPRALTWLLDRPGWLRWITRFGTSTDGATLGKLTVAMLQGEEGPLEAELGDLAHWLKTSFRPDIVHVTNSLLLGLVPAIRREVQARVVVGLQGEDLFLDQLVEPYKTTVLQEMRRRIPLAHRFVAPNAYYAGHMGPLLEIPRDHLSVVPLGIKVDHLDQTPQPFLSQRKGPVVIGHLARICPEKGLHVLAEAFQALCHDRQDLDPQLRVAGYLGSEYRSYLKEIEKRMEDWGLSSRFRYLGELGGKEKSTFLQSIHVLALPTTYREAKGLPALEALAAGVPVVLADHGSFPELVRATGGGLLVKPESPLHLKAGLEELLDNPDLLQSLGSKGRAAVHESFTDRVMARAMAGVYEEVLNQERGAPHVPG